VTLRIARWRMAKIWFGFAAVVLVILIAQAAGGIYGDDTKRAFSWALPNIIPNVALMFSVFAADALRPISQNEPKVRKQFLSLSTAVSAFYLVLLTVTLVSPPFVDVIRPSAGQSPIEFLELSNLWLTPLQGLAVTSVGVLFFVKDQD
ncbi:MAG: hypothetical protein RIG26_06110, partial [Thalassospira sp.]|uniref:hypothetical protein n=1 Tax=Thalassospira sp. TaxID=1912094 RepID=UPI0032EDA662